MLIITQVVYPNSLSQWKQITCQFVIVKIKKEVSLRVKLEVDHTSISFSLNIFFAHVSQ